MTQWASGVLPGTEKAHLIFIFLRVKVHVDLTVGSLPVIRNALFVTHRELEKEP